MFAAPAKELETLHEHKHSWSNEMLKPGSNPLAGVRGELFHMQGEFDVGAASELRFLVRGVPIVYDVGRQELSCAGKTAPLGLADGTIRLEVLVDRTSIEIFGNGGRIYMPIGVVLAENDKSLALHAKTGSARIRSMEVYRLRSAWE